MTSLIDEYINKRLTGDGLEKELLRLIAQYNKQSGNYLLVYAAAISKPVPATALSMDDYYIMADLLREAKKNELDVYIETPGGSGEAAEEVVNMYRSKFDRVNFIVSGEAKSAGTLVVLSGNNISMTQTGSLGPIDAQISIGRSVVSAHDYMEWVRIKQNEAQQTGKLSAFDATLIAQISPGELNLVNNALEFAKDLVKKWLPIYKFSDWTKTESRKIKVTDSMKKKAAENVANQLSDHSRWRSHGRSLKIADLEAMGLKINSLEDDERLCDIVNRIQVVLRLLFATTSTYKVFAVEGSKIFSTAIVAQPGIPPIGQVAPSQADSVQFEIPCQKCGTPHRLYAKFASDTAIDDRCRQQGFEKMPKDDKLVCKCGFEMDLTPMRNQIEGATGRKVVD